MLRSTATNGQAVPRIDFVTEAEHCTTCGGALRIQKSKKRTVVTLAQGPFEAREIRKQCRDCDCPPVGSRALRRLVRPGQQYGYDLIVHVGLSRYLEGQQREEIRRALLIEHGIHLSTGTISTLCDRFLSLVEALHVCRAPELRAVLQQDGYPMHGDATCEHGKGGLFVSLDGWRNWVLWAGRIPSESEAHLRPLVDRTVELFGNPIAVVRDMGDGVRRAVQGLRQLGIPDLICHYHFLAAVGDKLLDRLYGHLRGMLRSSKIRTDLLALFRDLRPYGTSQRVEGRFGPGRVRESLKALVLWLLEGDGSKDAPFPFALPHLEFVRRCRQALQQGEKWVPCPRTQPERRAIRHLTSLVSRLERDQRIAPTVQNLQARWRAFTEFRDVLRLSNAELPRGDTHYQQRQLAAFELVRLERIKKAVEHYQVELEALIPAEERDKSRPTSTPGIILKHLKRHREHLFGHPARFDEEGKVIAVVDRTNNVIEHFFGQEKRRLRRRLGRANLGRDLQQQPAQVALAANLRLPEYVRVVCGSLEDLPDTFAQLESRSLVTSAPVVRDRRNKPLQDMVRKLLNGRDRAEKLPQDQREHPPSPLLESNEFTSRLQELQKSTADELKRRCAQFFIPPAPPTSKPRDPRLPPHGTVLKRRFKGRTYRVTVLRDGFEYRNQHYTGLSTVAKEITGTTYSGYRFFQLRGTSMGLDPISAP